MTLPLPRDSDRIQQLVSRLTKEPMSRLFLELAREYHEAGRFEDAARVCAGGLKIHTTWRSARVLLGKIYFDMGRLDEAKEHLDEVVRHAPDNLVARRILADIFAEEGDIVGAIDRYRALLAFIPDDAEVAGRIEALEALVLTQLHASPAGAGPRARPEGLSSLAPDAPAALSPEDVLRRRKIAALDGWLTSIRGHARA